MRPGQRLQPVQGRTQQEVPGRMGISLGDRAPGGAWLEGAARGGLGSKCFIVGQDPAGTP